MRRTAQEGVFVLLKVIKRHEEKRPEGLTELTKLKTNKLINFFQQQIFLRVTG